MFQIWSKGFLLVGSNPKQEESPTAEEFNIVGFTGTVTTTAEDGLYITIYTFNPMVTPTKWISGHFDEVPDKFIYITENDYICNLYSEEHYAEPLSAGYYHDEKYFTIINPGTIEQIKLYSSTTKKINLIDISLENLGRHTPV